jgi:glycosyltransferase involved in cell wall biosynthesis
MAHSGLGGVAAPGGTNVHLYPSPLTHESRIDRICAAIEALDVFDRIVVVGVWQPGLAEREQISPLRQHQRVVRAGRRVPGVLGKVLMNLAWTGQVFWALRREPVSCVNCHSLPVLPLSVILKIFHRAKLVYDTHELETETTQAKGLRRLLLKALERALIPAADEVSVVSRSIGEWYRRTYGLKEVHVVRNVPDARPAAEDGPASDVLRRRLGVGPDGLLFLYQGVLAPGRRIEQFLRVFRTMPPDRHLVFLGFGPLESLIRTEAAARPNVHYIGAVPPAELLVHTAGVDVGLCGVENACLSYYFSLPNKLFEFLAAGVPAIVPDFPEMRAVVERHGCGWIAAESDAAWAETVGSVERSGLAAARARAVEASRHHTWNAEQSAVANVYRRLFRNGVPAAVPAESHD